MIVVPGIGGSGPDHWQTLWQGESDVRIRPSDWNAPDLDDWVAALDAAAVEAEAGGRHDLVVAHSLGCLVVAEWLARAPRGIGGCLYVAPPDPFGPAFPRVARGFGTLAAPASPVDGIVVASDNDPYGSIDYAARFARTVDAALLTVGPRGHLNADSGLGDWPLGRRALDELAA